MWSDLDVKEVRSCLYVFISVLLMVVLIQWLLKCYREIKLLPPGPWGIPVMGYLAFLGQEKHTQYMELAKKYGGVFSARLGTQLTVVVSDYKVIRDTFRKKEYTGRPDTPFIQTMDGFGEFL